MQSLPNKAERNALKQTEKTWAEAVMGPCDEPRYIAMSSWINSVTRIMGSKACNWVSTVANQSTAGHNPLIASLN
jgi:hypothetical protein